MQKEKQIAIKAVRAAGNVLSRHFKAKRQFTDHKMQFKGDADFATAADLEAEKVMLRIISKAFPKHAILSEEAGLVGNKKSAYKWIIDPLDGTHNFVFGIPFFGAAAALEVKGKVVLGAIYLPLEKELYVAEKGKGAWLNGRRIAVSKNKPEMCMMLMGGFWKYDDKLVSSTFRKLIRRFYPNFRALGASVTAYTLIASGRADGFVVLFDEPWDAAAQALLVEEAGGRVTDVRGRPWNPYQKQFIASNGVIHNAILKALK